MSVDISCPKCSAEYDARHGHCPVCRSPDHVEPVSRRGRQPCYQAKIGTHSSTLVIVKRARKFKVGQRIQFADVLDLQGCSVGMAPKWHHGIIWKIDSDRLFIEFS